MAATFSVNIGLSTEATTYDLIGATGVDLSQVLTVLEDNTSKQINPKDLRDVFLTTAANSIFTQTKVSNDSYIGIDTSDPLDGDLKNKIYFGKRSFSGTYSSYSPYQDIMSTSLLNSDVDIFLFNTKRDTISNGRTRVSILSGTKSSLYSVAPYLQVQTIASTSSLSFDIVNPSNTGGNINLTSDYGSVSVNNIVFPTISDSANLTPGLTGASDGRILVWNNGNYVWDNITLPSMSSIGVTGSPININGGPINVNGYPIEFTDSRPCLVSIGDIQMGETFSLVEMSEMLRRIVYSYLPPTCSVSVLPPYSSGYVEVGTSPLVKLNYTITKRTYPTNITSLSNMVPSSYPPISTAGTTVVSGTASGIVISPVSNTTTYFAATVGDGTQSNTSTASISGIYPYFYGFSALSAMNTAGLSGLTKLVEPLGDKTIDITGSGNLYFIYDSTYPDLDEVIDNISVIIGNSFSIPTLTILSSPSGLWASKQFKVYKWTGIPQVGPPSVNYQFKY
jgi:hypothetical protein